uniref:aECM cysteine-cradle domain-containing protein n=1 Tax=Strongyloides venezuelensis TaxID=75913 RepID=A0A0K0F0T1_STRVS
MITLIFITILSFLSYIHTLPGQHEEIIPGIGGLKILPLKKSNTTVSRKVQRIGPSFVIKVPENMYYRPKPQKHKLISQQKEIEIFTTLKPETRTYNNIVIPPSAKATNYNNVNKKQLSLKEIAIVTCKEIDVYRKLYKVNDIKTFAKDNCFLIQIYYPDISCSDINEMVDYCVKKDFFKE